MPTDPLRKPGWQDEPERPQAPQQPYPARGWAPPPEPVDPWAVGQGAPTPGAGAGASAFPPAHLPQGAPAGWGPPASGARDTSSAAIIALVLAVSSFMLLPLLPAVAALVVARSADRELAAAGGRLAGSGLTRAARMVAWANLVLCALVALLFLALVAAALPG